MKRVYTGLIGLSCAIAGLETSNAVTITEQGTGPAEVVMINCDGIGSPVAVYAGVLKLDVDGTMVDGFCIDPFHFSFGTMAGYEAVPLTSAPKGDFMSPSTALDIERLWGNYYSPTMSAADAAGVQIAIWELIGGSGFNLCSKTDYGAATFLSVVENPVYNGPVADLVGLTGPGQDYGVQAASLNPLADPVSDTVSTLALLGFTICGLIATSQKNYRLVRCRT